MTGQAAEPRSSFGGPWTLKKLDILESYLDAYTTALKNQSFELMYIDAFAGTGRIVLPDHDDDARSFVSGSAERAVGIADKPFDRLIFVERDRDRCQKLDALRGAHPDRKIRIVNSDANDFLRNLHEDWQRWRGVLFLDPFATEVEWATIETIADFKALDIWILFPTSAVARMLPQSRMPEASEKKWADRLTTVFGGESWRDLYQESSQGKLFEDRGFEREPGVDGLIGIYKEKLTRLLDDRFLQQSRTLRNSKNSALFEFLFCVGNPRGIEPAKRIAKHILDRM